MPALERVFGELQPELVVVAGDVNSTLAGAVAAAKHGITVCHIESGLRSDDWSMPEERNRVITDHLSALLLTHSDEANENLGAEGLDRQGLVRREHDDRHAPSERGRSAWQLEAWREFGLEPGGYVLVTLHRPSLVDDADLLARTIAALDDRRRVLAGDLSGASADSTKSRRLDAVLLTEPLPYRQFLSLEAEAAAVVTDSGGIQEETTALRVPCFTLRKNTERPDHGRARHEHAPRPRAGTAARAAGAAGGTEARADPAALGWAGRTKSGRSNRRLTAWSCGLKVWVDMTASAHVLVFRPLIKLLRERGDEVEITARDYAQTLQLLELHGLEATVVGRHGGRSRLGKARSLTSRLRALRKWARPRDFDLALAHGSHELTMTARRLGIPSATTHDYEFAMLQHHLGMRAATKVVVPDSIPDERLAHFGVKPPKLLHYPGLKEEYYLADFEPDARVLDELGVDRDRVLVVLRPPPDVSLYHRHSNPLFPQTLAYLGALETVHAVVLPRTDDQREYVRGLALPSVIFPERAVEAQSLIALADVVVSAGGTMNREAAALGVPVYTTYGGRLGGVDEELIRQGRLKPLTDPRALELQKREAGSGSRVRRDPAVLLDLLLTARRDDV